LGAFPACLAVRPSALTGATIRQRFIDPPVA